MDTKKKILEVALTLFSEKGYGNVYVGQIAECSCTVRKQATENKR